MNPPAHAEAAHPAAAHSGPATAGAWIRSRDRLWAEWLGTLRSRPAALSVAQAQRYVEQYRALAGDLATARRLLPHSATTTALESLYALAHASIDRSSRPTRSAWRALFARRIPAAMAALRPTLMWIALLFVLSALAGLWLITRYPDLIGLVASRAMIDKVEHGQLWTEGMFNIAPSPVLSVQILSNNIAVSVFAFCAGIFFGLGAFYIISLNGLMLGALFAFTHQHGLDGELLKFVLAHGPVEISVMCIAAAAGTALGESLIRPDAPTRREAFQHAAHNLGPVLIACALLLIVCGFIEGFISPNPRIALPVRAAIGLGYWALMLLFLRGGVRRRARLDTAPTPKT
ncbi:MAG TPA: stage II sporulation protein M [Steroidobacteraceae bacterium]